MRVAIKLSITVSEGYRTFALEDLGITEDEWGWMDEEQKYEFLLQFVYQMPEQPDWMIDEFEEINEDKDDE